jgi:aspartate/methionine/tyrosine aminotransferase
MATAAFGEEFLCERAKNLAPSGIRKFFDLAAKMKNACNLSLGQPDFDVPEAIKSAAIAAINDGHNRYTQTSGIAPLRDACREFVIRTQKVDLSNDEVLVTQGASGGLFHSFFCLLDRGDDVLVPDPYFVEYTGLASMTGARAVHYDTYPDFRLDVDKLEAARTPATKAIVINSPQNPTGTVYGETELRETAEWARKHGIFVISDEIYDIFVYDEPHISIKRFYPEGTSIVAGFSKTYGMPGWRMGYTVIPKWMVDKATVMQSYSFVCAPTPFQHA